MRKMFPLALLALAFLGVGCFGPPVAQNSPPPRPPATNETPRLEGLTFGSTARFTINQTHRFEDGMTATVTGIDDSRCPENVQCIWAGELAPALRLTGGVFGTSMHDVRLGTVRTLEVNEGSYHLVLVTADATTVSLLVDKNAVGAAGPVHAAGIVAFDLVENPLVITGEAPGAWFFEASFPVQLLDGNGKLIATAPAQAKSDWMTTAYVPFEATLTFQDPGTEWGTLVFRKDNPSGLPQNDAAQDLPIRFLNGQF